MQDKSSSDILKSFYEAQLAGTEFLKRENIYLKKLFEVSRQISTLDLMPFLKLIMENVLEITQAQRGFLILFDELKQLQFKVAVKLDEEILEGEKFEISRSIAYEVANSGKAKLIENVLENNEYKNRNSIIELELKAVMCVPLKIKNEIIGIIYVDSEKSFHSFSFKDLELFEAFASQASISIENARLFEQIKKENIFLKEEIKGSYHFGEIICESKKMKEVCRLAKRVLDNSITVLIEGETGTGKEMLARAIHYNSLRKDKKFVAQNCGALVESLLESELFGHKKGAFTGAIEDKMGLFEFANGGTIFLDEIGEASPAIQVRLLRVLETGTIRRVGDTMDRKIDVRVIAATNRNLKEEVEKGNFREDLYYRLSAFPIYIPPLRERKEDIPLLVQHFIQEYNKELKKNIQTISKELMEMLIQREWQGNIRELKNFIYRMMVLSPSDELLFVEDIPESQEAKDINELDVKDLENKFKTLEQVEKEYIEYVLQYVNGNRALAARCLKMSRTTLLGRMKKLGIT